MPITDNNFTAEELEAVVTANPEVLKSLEGYATKTGGLILADATKKTAYEQNLRVAHKSEITGSIAPKVEKFVKDTTGIDKAAPDEKWYKYNERVVKSLADSNKADKAELTRLKGSADITAAERARIQELEGLVASSKQQLQTLQTEFLSKESKMKASLHIVQSTGSTDSKLKKTPELQEAIQIVREKVLGDMSNEARVESDGSISFIKPDGKYYTNPDASKMNAEQVYALKMDKYIDKGQIRTGGGGDGGGGDDVVALGNLKTKTDVDLFLSAKGLLSGSPAYQAELKKYNYDKLPLQ